MIKGCREAPAARMLEQEPARRPLCWEDSFAGKGDAAVRVSTDSEVCFLKTILNGITEQDTLKKGE